MIANQDKYLAALIMLKCTSCGGNLEAGASQVDPRGSTAVLRPGTILECPHCHTEHAAGVELPRQLTVQNFGGLNFTAGNSIHINVGGDVVTGDKIARRMRRAARREQRTTKIIHTHLVRIVNLISEHFNMSDVEELCFEFDVNFDEIAGSTISAKGRNLVLFAKRRKRMFDLLDSCRDLRPEVGWPTWEELTGKSPKPPLQSTPQPAAPTPAAVMEPIPPALANPMPADPPQTQHHLIDKIKAWWQSLWTEQ